MSYLDRKDLGFIVRITQAYCFRCLTEMISQTVNELNITVNESGLNARQLSDSKTIFHNLLLYGDEFKEFYLHQDLEAVDICVNMDNLNKKFKPIKKKQDEVIFYNLLNNSDKFFAVIGDVKQENTAAISIPTLITQEQPVYDLPSYDKPNLIITVSELVKGLPCLTKTIDCKYIEFMCFENGILIKAMMTKDKDPESVFPLGEKMKNPFRVGFDEAYRQGGRLISTYRTLPNVVKSFTKIPNISPENSSILIYYSEDNALKMRFRVGTFGIYEIYITDNGDL